MTVKTVTVGSMTDVYNGKADMTEKGCYKKDQLEKDPKTGKIKLKGRGGGGSNASLDLWRKCVEDTRKEGDTKTVPPKDSAHYKRARDLYNNSTKQKETDDEKK